MKSSIRAIIKKYIAEEKIDWLKEHCKNSFSDKSEINFCLAATNVLKKDDTLQKNLESALKKFFEIHGDTIMKIKMETLTEESPIAISGLKEFEWVKKQGTELCPNIKDNITVIYNNLLNGIYVVYVDPKTREYHPINRLDTNYSALAVMITEYFRDLDAIYTLNLNGIRYQKDWEQVANYLVRFVIYPNSFHPSNSDIQAIRKIETDQKPLRYIFEKLLNNLDSKISSKTHQVLSKVREVGFGTENKFIDELNKYGITYKNFGKDYGFVDRFLGIDIFIELLDGWYPAQVKSTEREKTLISRLGCEGSLIVYPDEKGNFWVNNFTFERFFCKMNKVCTKNPNETQ
jgi:hypothetical protein